jgi:8-oxo-dGTP pyrophosphatase MutT (NUDIX family)
MLSPTEPRPSTDENHNPWVTQSSEVRYQNPWISVRHDEVLDPSGKPGIYGVVSPRNYALGVLPFFDDGTVILVGQYRYALDRYSWEMPEGGGLKHASREESIARELSEETGHIAKHWFPIIVNGTLSNSITDECVYCWAAWGLTAGERSLESTEHDLVSWRVPFAHVVSMVWDHEIHDSLTTMTVARIEAMRLRHELPPELQEILR